MNCSLFKIIKMEVVKLLFILFLFFYASINLSAGNSTHTYQFGFTAGFLAEIAVSGNGYTDQDLYAYDSNGNYITGDESYSDDCYVCLRPAWTGRFIVKVVSRDPLYNRYVLLTN